MYRLLISSAAFLLVFAPPSVRADDDKPKDEARVRVLEALMQRFTQVVPKDLVEKLKLTDEQKKELGKLQRQLDLYNLKVAIKVVGTVDTIEEAIARALTSKDTDMLEDLALAFAAQAIDSIRMRRDLDSKFKGLLNEEQKKIYSEQNRGLLGLRRPKEPAEKK